MFVSKWSRSNYLRPTEISRDGRATKIQIEWVHTTGNVCKKFFLEVEVVEIIYRDTDTKRNVIG